MGNKFYHLNNLRRAQKKTPCSANSKCWDKSQPIPRTRLIDIGDHMFDLSIRNYRQFDHKLYSLLVLVLVLKQQVLNRRQQVETQYEKMVAIWFSQSCTCKLFHALLREETSSVVVWVFSSADFTVQRPPIVLSLFNPLARERLHRGLCLFPRSRARKNRPTSSVFLIQRVCEP